MKICLIGVFSGDLDEGYKNIAFSLSQKLSRKHDVLTIDTSAIFSLDSWKQIKDFKPDILHYLTAPTLSSFIVLRIAKLCCKRDVKLVVSSLRPYCLKLLKNPVLKRAISLVRPDLILTQCNEVKEILEGMGCNTTFLPNGVDTERFTPVSNERKEELREKYGVDKEKFVILHVGHIRAMRGIKLFKKIQNEDEKNQVIVVGSSYFKTDEELYRDLINSDCLVWQRYFENIEEVYALADCYVFPTPIGESIFMPLSVLEAMSCNLPVLSTKYEGLVDNFEEEGGLIFFDDEVDLCVKLEAVKNGIIKPKTREKVLPCSWDNVYTKLEYIYGGLVHEVSEIKRRGIFICFTGMDGAGKTTLAKFLIDDLHDRGIKSRYVYNRYVPIILRPIMLIGKLLFLRDKDFYKDYTEYSNTKRTASRRHSVLARLYQRLLLFDYFFQILFKIKLPLLFGKNIVCDRYIYDTIVTDLSVDFNYSEEDVQKSLYKILSWFPTPNITFLVDLPEKIAYQRKDDVPSIDYLKDRRETYLHMGKECEMMILDGVTPLDELKSVVKGNVWRLTNE